MVKITIPIEPQQQERPRYAKRGRFVQVYDPKKTKQFKKQLGAYIREYMKLANISCFERPITVLICFYRPVQKSLSGVEKRRRLSSIHPPQVKPDLSNFLKSTEDALNGILWKDDALIISEHLCKLYSEEPHIEIIVNEWNKELWQQTLKTMEE